MNNSLQDCANWVHSSYILARIKGTAGFYSWIFKKYVFLNGTISVRKLNIAVKKMLWVGTLDFTPLQYAGSRLIFGNIFVQIWLATGQALLHSVQATLL